MSSVSKPTPNKDELGSAEVTTMARCTGSPDCENEALRNFPSEQECEHEACLSCLDKMIAECQICDYLPMCPNENCRIPYRFESVASLRALLPERATFFAGLALELNQGYETIRDDTVTPIDIPPDYKAKDKHFEIKCGISEEEGPVMVSFSKIGTLGEFIREVRHTLRIMPTEKVYGYFKEMETMNNYKSHQRI